MTKTASNARHKRPKITVSPSTTWATNVLSREVARLSTISGGVVGVAAEHLETGRRFAQNGDEPFPMASTFKIAVAGAVLRQIDDGMLEIGRMIAIGPDDRVDSDVIAAKLPHAGVALSVHNLLEVMLTQSDNTATDVLMKTIGGAAGVNAWLNGLGIRGQRVDRDTATLLRDFFQLPPGPVARTLREPLADRPELERLADLPNPDFDDDPRDTSTPIAMLDLLKAIQCGQALSPANTGMLVDILSRCATGDARLRGRLPPGTRVSDKTGTIGGTVNDVGIISLPDESHLAVAIFVKKGRSPPADRERAIAEIARVLHDAFLLAS